MILSPRVFFSFHYDEDVYRVQQIREFSHNTDKQLFRPNIWEKVRKETHEEIARWINTQMKPCPYTIVLIGSQTSNRYWVDYEIKTSIENGNGLLGIYVHNIKDRHGNRSFKGENPFLKFQNLGQLSEQSVQLFDIESDSNTMLLYDIAAYINRWSFESRLRRRIYG